MAAQTPVPVVPARQGPSVDHQVELGLGQALVRRDMLAKRYNAGVATGYENAERLLIEDALNSIRVKLQASCVPGEDMNADGIPDTVEFFELMASGSCGCEVRQPPVAPKKSKVKVR